MGNQIFTENTIMLVIICTAIILIVLCIPTLIGACKAKPANWADKKDVECRYKYKLNRTHHFYIIGILVFLIVLLFSYNFYELENVFNFMSFASAIISIILAIITIIYSFYTNSRSDGQIDVLNKAANDVKDATEKYERSTSSFNSNIGKILEAIERVEATTININDKIKGAESQSNRDNSDIFKDDGRNFNLNKYIEDFVNTTSIIGNMTLYACIKSKDTNIEFSLKSLNKYLGYDNDNVIYSYGYMIAATSAGILNINSNSNTFKVLCSGYTKTLKTKILDWFDNQDKEIKEAQNEIDNFFKNLSNNVEMKDDEPESDKKEPDEDK